MRKVLVGVCPSDRHTPQGVSHGTKPGRRPPDRTAGLHPPRPGCILSRPEALRHSKAAAVIS